MLNQNLTNLKTASHNNIDTINDTPLYEQDEVIERAIKYLENRIRCNKEKFIMPAEVCRYLRLQLANEINEVFAVLFLDSARRFIAFEKIFYGTINTTMVHPRVIIQKAIQYNAASVIFAHNHPSGITNPSIADENITRILKNLLKEIDVIVLDHFIVSIEGYFSFAENNLI